MLSSRFKQLDAKEISLFVGIFEEPYYSEALRLLSLRPNVVSREQEGNSNWFSEGEFNLFQWKRHRDYMIEQLGESGLSIMTKIGIDTDE